MNDSDNLFKTFLMNVPFLCEMIKMAQVANLFQLNLISLNESARVSFHLCVCDMKWFFIVSINVLNIKAIEGLVD